MSISFNHPKNTMSSTGTLVLTVPSGTPSTPQPIRFDSSSVIMPVRALPVGEAGSMVFDNASKTLKYHNGTIWIEIQDTDTILQPIYVDLTAINAKLNTKVDSVNYSSATVPSASISGTTLSIVFPQTGGGSSNAPSGLFTSSKPGSIMQYSLTSGQTIASIREQMSGVANGQSGRAGTQANPFVTSDGWCLGDGMWWRWEGSGGTIVKQVPNLNRGCYLQGLPNVTNATTNISSVQSATGTIGGTALTIAQLPPHSFSVSGNTSSSGDHSHGVPLRGSDRSGSNAITASNFNSTPYNISTDNAGDHIHTFNGTTNTLGSGQTHSHSVSNINVDHFTVAYLYNIAEGSLSITQQIGDSRYVLKSGDTMTGSLTIANQVNLKGNSSTLSFSLLNASGGERAAIFHNSGNSTLNLRANGGPAVTISNTGTVTIPGIATINGNATVNGKNVVRSINNVTAGSDGDVSLNISTTSASLSQNGWYKDENTGMITQWGYISVPDDSYVTVTLPIPYPNACLNLQVTGRVSQAPDNQATWSGAGNILGKTQIAVGAANPSSSNDPHGLGVYWTTIGY